MFFILQDEYVKAYYAALLKKQQELEEAAKEQQEPSSVQILNATSSSTFPGRQVGLKSKRGDDDEGDDDVDWEEAPVAGMYLCLDNLHSHFGIDLFFEHSTFSVTILNNSSTQPEKSLQVMSEYSFCQKKKKIKVNLVVHHKLLVY